MTPPRRIIAGQTWFISVRAVARTFRFVPKRKIRKVTDYAVVAIAEKYAGRVLLHEFEFLSNHFHLVLTDVVACLPDFMRDLDAALASNLNAVHGVNGTCIEKTYSAVAVQDEAKVLEHVVYTLANACSANLVSRTKHWEGTSSFKHKYGEVMEVRRPKLGVWKYADDDDRARRKKRRRRREMNRERQKRRSRISMPAVARATLVRPPIFAELSDVELRKRVMDKLARRENQLIVKRRREGTRVLGMKVVKKQEYWMSPATAEDMFRTKPSVSAKSKWARIEALAQRAKFIEAYRRAREAFCAGDRDVVFPRGTWLMRRRFDVRCHSSP